MSCFSMLKEGLTDSDMSLFGRAFCILAGGVGTILVDPVIAITKASEEKDNNDNSPEVPCNNLYD